LWYAIDYSYASVSQKAFQVDFLPPITQLVLFIPVVIVLAITPGPAVTYIIARSIDQGRKAGLVSVGAVASGNVVHAIGAALGLSAILASSALAFDIVKYLGAAYLIYLGIRALLTKTDVETAENIESKKLSKIYRDGVMVAILNPKTALFFLSLLPQFIDHTRPVSGQMLFLGLLFVAVAAFTDSLYAIASGTAGRWLRANKSFQKAQRYITGTVYIGLGLTAAFSGGRRGT
jgi:threonine/homoserine/homoserine lactone efflux protein